MPTAVCCRYADDFVVIVKGTKQYEINVKVSLAEQLGWFDAVFVLWLAPHLKMAQSSVQMSQGLVRRSLIIFHVIVPRVENAHFGDLIGKQPSFNAWVLF